MTETISTLDVLQFVAATLAAIASGYAWVDARRRSARKDAIDALTAEADLLEKLSLLDDAHRSRLHDALAKMNAAKAKWPSVYWIISALCIAAWAILSAASRLSEADHTTRVAMRIIATLLLFVGFGSALNAIDFKRQHKEAAGPAKS